MNGNNGGLYFGAGIDNSSLKNDANKSKEILHGIGKSAIEEGKQIDSIFKNIGKSIAGAFAAVQLKDFTTNIVKVRGEFQKMEAVLSNTLGSDSKAANAMKMLTHFGATTPFQVNELTNSFIKLAGNGFVPVEAELTKLGDLASSRGKSFDQLTEAIIDAEVGEFERLKEFGIRASKDGEKITFTFKGVKKTVDMTSESIRGYILSLGELEGVAGANAQIAATIEGKISNIEDAFDSMLNNIGKNSEGLINDALEATSFLIENYETVGETLGSIIATYGVYKAAVLANIAISKIEAKIVSQAALEKALAAKAGIALSEAEALAAAKTKMLTIATTNLKTAMSSLSAKIMAHPFALAAAAATATILAVTKLSAKYEQQEIEVATLSGEMKEISNSAAKERAELDKLYQTATNDKKNREERAEAARKMIELYPDELRGLDKEAILAGKASSAYDKLKDSIIETARARAAQSAIEKNSAKLLELESQKLEIDSDEEKSKKVERGKKADKTKKNVEKQAVNTFQAYGMAGMSMSAYSAASKIATKEEDDRLYYKSYQKLNEDIENLKKENKKIASLVDLDILKEDKEEETPENHGSGLVAEIKKAAKDFSSELKETEKELQNETTQNRIDAMSEGTDKEIAQIEFDTERKKDAIRQSLVRLATNIADESGDTVSNELNKLLNSQVGTAYKEALDSVDNHSNKLIADVLGRQNSKSHISAKDIEAETKEKKKWEDFQTLIRDVNKTFEELGDTIGGAIGKGVEAMGEFSTDTLSFMNGLKGFQDAEGGLEKAIAGTSMVQAGIQAAVFAYQGIPKLFGADYSDYNAMVEKYDNLIDVWDQLIDRKKEYISQSYGAEAAKAGSEAISLINQESEAWRKLGKERLDAGTGIGSHSIGIRQQKRMDAEDMRAAIAVVGEAAVSGRMTGLFDLSVQQLEKLQENAPSFWAKLDDDVKEYLENIIEGAERLEDITESVKEQLTGITFDSMFEDFESKLQDMGTGFKDFSKDSAEYFRKQLISMMASGYKEELEKWYEKWATSSKDGITPSEITKFQEEYSQIVSDALAQREQLKETFGWTDSATSGNEGSTKGFATANQDSVNELNGRFTAMQISLSSIEDDTAGLRTQSSAIAESVAEMKGLSMIAIDHLENIERNTYQLHEMKTQLASIERNTRNM